MSQQEEKKYPLHPEGLPKFLEFITWHIPTMKKTNSYFSEVSRNVWYRFPMINLEFKYSKRPNKEEYYLNDSLLDNEYGKGIMDYLEENIIRWEQKPLHHKTQLILTTILERWGYK